MLPTIDSLRVSKPRRLLVTPAQAWFGKEGKGLREEPAGLASSFWVSLLAMKIPGKPDAAPGIHSFSSRLAPHRHISASSSVPTGNSKGGPGPKPRAWLQSLPPRSSGGRSPSGKGDDATGGNAVPLGQQRALCQVPLK